MCRKECLYRECLLESSKRSARHLIGSGFFSSYAFPGGIFDTPDFDKLASSWRQKGKNLTMEDLFKDHIPLLRPWLGQEEVQAATEVIMSGWISQGSRVAEFE